MDFHGPIQGENVISGIHNETGGTTIFNIDGKRPRTPPKPSSNVPFRRDQGFINRGDILSRVDERCCRPAGRAALVGFGGFGKSQLAIEYAHRVHQRSPEIWIFWVFASNSARLEEAFSDIAYRVGLSSRPDVTPDIIPAVRTWLCTESNGRWLIIVDNIDDEIAIESQNNGQTISMASLLPQSDHGAVLVTSRNTDVARSLVDRQQDIIEVGPMSEREAVTLLQNKLGDSRSDNTAELVNALECIPLAIVQAAAYINRLQPYMSVANYLSELTVATKRVRLLEKAASDMRRDEQASNSVLKTWQISFNYIRQKRPSAADLLSFMSLFNRHGIPEFIVRYYISESSEGKYSLSTEDLERGDGDFKEDIAMLRAFSLVGATQREDEFEMHGLIQLATQIWLNSIDTQQKWRQLFVHAMFQEFPFGEYENWPKCRVLFPHVLPVVEQDWLSDMKSDQTATLLYHIGWYAWRQGLFPLAETVLNKGYHMYIELFDAEDRKALDYKTMLAYALTGMGKHEAAEAMYWEVLVGNKKVLGKEHSATLTSMGNLALILNNRAKFKEAEAMNREAVAGFEKVLGAEHRDTLMSINNLALTLQNQGKYEEAESLNRQTLAKREDVFGVEHPDTLLSMHNLAATLWKQDKYEEAEAMHRQTLEKRKEVLGAEHPDTLMSIGNLALVLQDQGKFKEAESLIRQTLAKRKDLLGAEHPDTLMAMSNLALVLQEQGKYEEAESLNRQTLAKREDVLGPEHPSTLTSMNNLASVLQSQGKYKDAESLNRQALAKREDTLGLEHPDTLMTVNNLALVLQDQGKYKDAESLNRQTLAKREEILGPGHPSTLNSVFWLARLLENHRRYSESIVLYERAYVGLKAVLGEDHPDTRVCYEWYSKILASQEVNQLLPPPQIPDHSINMHTGKKSKLARGLAKIGIGSSTLSRK